MHIVHARVTTKTTLQPIFEKTAGLFNFKGKVAESHRLFLFCADLFMEAKAIPWATVPSWDETARPTIEWLLTQTGPQDVLVFCDGRSRSWRGKLEELLKEMRHVSEMWVVYQPSPRLGRKVSFGSDNREVILVSTPVARTLLPVRDRAQFGAAGESSTHDSSYTGVPPLPWGGVPHLSSSDKAKILGHEIEEPPDRLFDTSLGQPLFWAERKSNGFFQRLFQDLSAKVVIDCTPGCGSAGRACLDLGLQYLAFGRNAEHASWLVNVLDRAALKTICASGSPLFDQDLASAAAVHFKDLLDQLHEADNCADDAPQDEDFCV